MVHLMRASTPGQGVYSVLPSGGTELAVRGLTLVWLGCLAMIAGAPAQHARMGTQVSSATVPQAPGLRRERLSEAVSVEGLIRLDVAVTDATGKAVRGLKRTDFKVRDNGQTREIIAFREPRGLPADVDPLTVILLIDTLGLPPRLAALEREQAARFLRQSAGH